MAYDAYGINRLHWNSFHLERKCSYFIIKNSNESASTATKLQTQNMPNKCTDESIAQQMKRIQNTQLKILVKCFSLIFSRVWARSMSAKYELHCAPHLIFAGIYFVFFLSLALHLLHFEIRINNQTWTNWYSNKILCWDTREIACCFVYFCIQCDSMSFNTFENKSRKKSMCIFYVYLSRLKCSSVRVRDIQLRVLL